MPQYRKSAPAFQRLIVFDRVGNWRAETVKESKLIFDGFSCSHSKCPANYNESEIYSDRENEEK